MKKILTFIAISAIIISLFPHLASAASYDGKIFLQVQQNGEAWYVNPSDHFRYYLGRPADAFSIMKALGLGITEKDIKQIPVGLIKSKGNDDDLDGLVNDLELAIGTDLNKADTDLDDYSDKSEVESWHNPIGPGKLSINQTLVNKLRGKILLQVEKHGEAWYLNPSDGKRYFLGRPQNAFEIMRGLGTGITTVKLNAIPENFTKTTFTVSDEYEIKYPQNWNKEETKNPTGKYLDIPITHALNLTNSTKTVFLNVYVLEGVKDYTLGNFSVSAKQSAVKATDENIMVGIKPAYKQKFKYHEQITAGKITNDKGAEIFVDIMLSTKKFIHLQLVVLNEDDVDLYESYFDQIIKNFKLL